MMCYLREFLAKPHPAVGRPGPVCPFVPTSLKKDLIYMSVIRTSGLSEATPGTEQHELFLNQVSVWCVECGVWCVVCGVWCVVCAVWCVVRGAWCAVRSAWRKARGLLARVPLPSPPLPPPRPFPLFHSLHSLRLASIWPIF